jgi:hypothetical protein
LTPTAVTLVYDLLFWILLFLQGWARVAKSGGFFMMKTINLLTLAQLALPLLGVGVPGLAGALAPGVARAVYAGVYLLAAFKQEKQTPARLKKNRRLRKQFA